jgi:hypothetical protein
MDEDENFLLHSQVNDLRAEIQRLEMSNVRLVAELGRIAQALGVACSMVAVLAKIEELKK